VEQQIVLEKESINRLAFWLKKKVMEGLEGAGMGVRFPVGFWG